VFIDTWHAVALRSRFQGGTPRERHAVCELQEGRVVLFKWESHNLNLRGTAWERHAMCELAFTVLLRVT
jgi:hypothetical protein